MRISSLLALLSSVSRRTLRVPALVLLGFAAFFVAPPSLALVTIDWVPIGDPGNGADTTLRGAVNYSYYISKYEITNAQYAEFLNSKAAADPLGLYNTFMGSDTTYGDVPVSASITRSGSSGSYTYSVTAGSADKPVELVSLWDALRFANWLNNGQGSGDTETGAYTITLTGITNNTITREALANTFLPTVDEWYKAAYYSPGGVYFDYPTGTDTQTVCTSPTTTPNSANCNNINVPVGPSTNVGAYTGSASPYGTYDQGGNVWEWTESKETGLLQYGTQRGGGWLYDAMDFKASLGSSLDAPENESLTVGFRVASLIPEPGTGLLVMTGLVGLAYRQRRYRGAA